jgi:hypothetical protein
MTALILYTTDDGRKQIKPQADPVDKAEKKTLEHTTRERPMK